MVDEISFFCAGTPEPKGSTRAFVVKGHAVTTSSNRNLKQWELRIAHEAQVQAVQIGWTFSANESYNIKAHFSFPIPGSYPKKWWFAHTKRPDLDKLGRALNDALINVLFLDDSQVTKMELSKAYCQVFEGERPGVEVTMSKYPRKVPR